ncbi:chemotaxis protein CheD [bacterium]|nr:chemotaxis protein CheD [bacterium]
MKKIINVLTGEVIAAKETTILKSAAIGSCVVIAAYDTANKTGALAHVMLPGASPGKDTFPRTRYADEAIVEMIGMMTRLGTDRENIEVCLVGGANVLQREDDTICQAVVDSVIELLHKQNIEIKAKAVGGMERRNVSLDVKKGTIHYTEGDAGEKLLWETRERSASLVTRVE